MKRHILLIVAAFNAALRTSPVTSFGVVSAANEEDAPEREFSIANGDGDGEAMFQADAESLFIPYGNYPHKVGLQKFNKASAEAMVSAWNTLGEKVRRVFKKIPVYIGHPDVPALRQFYPDTKAYGWVEGMAAENEGLRMPVKWTEAGREMIENGHYKFYSPFWDLKQVAGGLSPVRMKSVGLTNNNNIPVPALANEAPAAVSLPSWLMEVLGIAADSTEEQAKTALTAKMDQAGKAQDLADSHAKLQKKEKEVSDAHDKLSKAYTEHKTATDAVKAMAANERAARIALTLAPLITSARVLAAEQETLTVELSAANEEEFTSKITEIAKRAPQLKTVPITKNLGNAKPEIHAANEEEQRSQQRRDAVAEEIKLLDAANSGRSDSYKHSVAWSQAEKKHPELFNATPAN